MQGDIKTYQITFEGIVQGVGFRPSVLRISEKEDVPIRISNSSKGVCLKLNAFDEHQVKTFIGKVLSNLPQKATVYSYQVLQTDFESITKSEVFYDDAKSNNTSFITPDYAWCVACQNEYVNRENRRYQFHFIGCTQCGPRFSVIDKMPFERENTPMKEFPMCRECKEEYDDIRSRRFFSQLNSCQTCNFSTALVNDDEKQTGVQIKRISELIKDEKIIAVKGIAGFLLVCDPWSENAVRELRKRKYRPRKPFAIMAVDMAFVEKYFYISAKEKEAMMNDAHPIILLYPREDFAISNEISTNNLIGVMLAPSAYLHELCSNNNGIVLATSANISEHPLVYKNEIAEKELSNIADHVWHYERTISFPQDDSVMCFSPVFQQQIFLRKARGFSPSTLELPQYNLSFVTLGLGAEMKSTFTLGNSKQVYISPYLGALTNQQNLEHFTTYLERFKAIFADDIRVIVMDWHPYFYYKNMFFEYKNEDVTFFEVQHHFAHAVAILGEKRLLQKNQERIACFVFDGVGLGNNNEIWGAEVFIFKEEDIIHESCFPFYHYLLGDKMSYEPRISFFSVMNGMVPDGYTSFYSKIENRNWKISLSEQIKTNSMGRILDALAFCLGFPHKTQSFEGECGQWLESQITRNISIDFLNKGSVYFENFPSSWEVVFDKIIEDKQNQLSNDKIILQLFKSISVSICNYARNKCIANIAFSGGVFQNRFLVDCITYESRQRNIKCLFHQYLSPNDENISYGQVLAANFFQGCEWVKKLNFKS